MMTLVRVTRNSADDPPVPYEALEGTGVLSLPVEQHAAEPMGDGFIAHHLYVQCQAIKNALLPLDANPREPAKTGGQVGKMQKSLRASPKDFVKLNNGMTLLCDRLLYDERAGTCSITFSEDQGVCNGGHTFFSIVTLPTPLSAEAKVHLEVIEFPAGLPAEQRVKYASDIASARNDNAQLQLRSQADFLSYYEWFKAFLSDVRFVSWHENERGVLPGNVRAELFIRYLSALDVDEYYHPVWHPVANDRHIAPVLGGGENVHKSWFNKMASHVRESKHGLPPLGEYAALANDVFEIRDYISRYLKAQPNGGGALGDFRRMSLYKEQLAESVPDKAGKDHPNLRPLLTLSGEQGCDIASPLEVLLIGLFRTNIWMHCDDSDNVQYVGWYKEPKSLWKERATEVLTAIGEEYKNLGSDVVSLVRSKFPYTNDLLTMVGAPPPPDPAIIYDAWKGHKFARELNPANATHRLQDGAGGGMFEVRAGGTVPTGSFLYKKVYDGTVRDMWTR
jgi:hypothetical protein